MRKLIVFVALVAICLVGVSMATVDRTLSVSARHMDAVLVGYTVTVAFPIMATQMEKTAMKVMIRNAVRKTAIKTIYRKPVTVADLNQELAVHDTTGWLTSWVSVKSVAYVHRLRFE